MTRRGTVTYAAGGGVFGFVWCAVTTGSLIGALVGCLLVTRLNAAIACSWEK